MNSITEDYPIDTTAATVEAIRAVDRLSSWVRSDSFRRGYLLGSPKRAIYAMKSKLIGLAQAAGWAEHRKVQVTPDCRSCGGSGKFTAWWSGDRQMCRTCGGTGRIPLSFLETFLGLPPGGEALVWHTPWEKAPASLSLPGQMPQHPAEGWLVNQPGRDLTPGEAARDLLIMERFREAQGWVYQLHYDYRYHWDGLKSDIGKYALYLGAREETCGLCGSHDLVEGGFRVDRGAVMWTDRACRFCVTLQQAARKKGQSHDLFELFPYPSKLLEDPAIRRFVIWKGEHDAA